MHAPSILTQPTNSHLEDWNVYLAAEEHRTMEILTQIIHTSTADCVTLRACVSDKFKPNQGHELGAVTVACEKLCPPWSPP
jgi:hypothetical protein